MAQITSRNAINLTEAGVRSDAGMKTFLQNQFKIVKDCTGDPSDCLADSYTNMNGGAVTSYSDTTAPCFVLASGAAICAKYSQFGNMTCTAAGEGEIGRCTINTAVGDLIVDINGKQGPNVVGRDLFLAGIYNDGSVSSASSKANKDPGDLIEDKINPTTSLQKCQRATKIERQGDASYCFNEILSNNWEMDY